MVTLAAGHSLNWFKETFAPTKSFEELLSRVDEIMLDSLGLFFTSYLVGERTPYFDSQIIGIDTRHTLDNFARAVLEGVTFSLKDSQRFVDPDGELKWLVSVIDGVKNRSWLQMQADIFVLPVTTLKVEQGPGFGADMLAAVGVGWFASLTECAECFVRYGEVFTPNLENVAKYAKLYASYQKIYPQTKVICEGEIVIEKHSED